MCRKCIGVAQAGSRSEDFDAQGMRLLIQIIVVLEILISCFLSSELLCSHWWTNGAR